MISQRILVTIGLAILLAILVVPFGGRYTLPALLAIAGLAVFDIWWQLQPRGGVSLYQRVQNAPLWMKLGVLALGFVVVLLLRT